MARDAQDSGFVLRASDASFELRLNYIVLTQTHVLQLQCITAADDLSLCGSK